MCVYAYWLHHAKSKEIVKAGIRKVEDVLIYPCIWLVGRALFTVLYLIGTIINYSGLRSAGFITSITSTTSLLVESLTGKALLFDLFA